MPWSHGGKVCSTPTLVRPALPGIGALIAIASTVLVRWIDIDTVYEPPAALPDGTLVDDEGGGGGSTFNPVSGESSAGGGGGGALEGAAVPLLVPAAGGLAEEAALDELHAAADLPRWLQGASRAVGVPPAWIWGAGRSIAATWRGIVGGT